MFDGVDAEMVWKERYEQQILEYLSLIANEYSASNCGLTLDHLCIIVSECEDLLDRYKTTRDKYFAILIYSIFECARPTGYYESGLREVATFGGIDLKKYGLLNHPVDVVNYLIAASTIERVLINREPSDESYRNPDEIYFENPVPEYELSKCDFGVEPLNHCTYMNANELYQEVPPRYSSYLNKENHCRLSEEDALTLLMEKCDYYAGDMCINVLRCGTIRWSQEEERIKFLIGRFFSKVLKLELCCYSDDTETVGALKDIMEAILSTSSLQLFSLTILEANDDHINAIAPLLSNPNVPCRIEELCLDSIALADFNSANALSDILSSQSKVSSLKVHLLDGTITGSRFTTSIFDLLQRPHFKCLSLELVTFSRKTVQTLITTFLTTPCSQAQSVTLHVHVSFTESSSDLGQILDIPQSTLEYKSLNVHTHTCYNISPWLWSLQPLKLKSLCVSSVQNVDRSSLALAAHHTSLHVSHLKLETTDFSTEDFQTLLQNESLKELAIVPNGPVGLCDITHGLLKLSETRTLEKLTVNSFTPDRPHRFMGSVKASSKVEVEQFSETVFSLPHLKRFSLELSIELDQSSDMTAADLIETMLKSWERKGMRLRLKKFVLNLISRTRYLPPLDENSQSVAEEVGMEVNIKRFRF